MKKVIVEQYGGPEVLRVVEDVPANPGAGEVVVRMTSIGLNHAELMGRNGRYKASTGEPPFTPGIEGGGVIASVGAGVDPTRVGQRVSLGPNLPRGIAGPHGGTYRTHMAVDAGVALPAPDCIPDDQLGAIWLPYLTAWGCLAWKAGVKPGDIVGIPAASSSVGLAAAQVCRQLGATAIGLTSSPDKAEQLHAMPTAAFDHLVVTHRRDEQGARVMRKWHHDIKRLTDGHGVDTYFDPVGAGPYFSTEIRSLAVGGRIFVYGLLGEPGVIDLSPMIIRQASVHPWMLYESVAAGEEVWRGQCQAIFEAFESGVFQQRLGGIYPLAEARRAHEEMQRGEHIGKLVLVP